MMSYKSSPKIFSLIDMLLNPQAAVCFRQESLTCFFLLLILSKSQLSLYMVTQIIEKILPRNVYPLNCGSFYMIGVSKVQLVLQHQMFQFRSQFLLNVYLEIVLWFIFKHRPFDWDIVCQSTTSPCLLSLVESNFQRYISPFMITV